MFDLEEAIRVKSHAGRKSSPGDHTLQRMARTLREITSAHRYAPREVVSDPKAPYFGVEINDRSLTLGEGARIAATHFDDWLNTSAQK